MTNSLNGRAVLADTRLKGRLSRPRWTRTSSTAASLRLSSISAPWTSTPATTTRPRGGGNADGSLSRHSHLVFGVPQEAGRSQRAGDRGGGHPGLVDRRKGG